MPKRETNEEFIVRLLNHSRYGGLSQVFILSAIRAYSDEVAEKEEIKGNDLISGETWQAIAREIQQEFSDRDRKAS